MKRPNANEVSRRTVLKRGAIVSGGVLVGGSATTGTAAASPRTNFTYTSADVDVGDEVELVERRGHQKIRCVAEGTITTTEWKVEGNHDGSWYFIPDGYNDGDQVKVTDDNVAGCGDGGPVDKEVEVTKISD